MAEKRKIIFVNDQSPGDVMMLTAAIRDLHKAYPGKYVTDVGGSCKELWENNPYLTKLDKNDSDVDTIICKNYDLINSSNSAPYHFIHCFTQFIEDQLDIRIPMTQFKGDIHISDAEKSWMSQVAEMDIKTDFWILVSGGKYDFTAKWTNPDYLQEVVDYFAGKITFVQTGSKHHWHPKLNGTIDLIDKTDLRQFIRLVYHSVGVLCPVTLAMHLAAAVPMKKTPPKNRACVVIAGGREPANWEAYPHHRYLATNGSLTCCDHGGCWKSRATLVQDGDEKNTKNTCEFPIAINPVADYPKDKIDGSLKIAQCIDMIESRDIIRAIETYYSGNILRYNDDKKKVDKKAESKKKVITEDISEERKEETVKIVSEPLKIVSELPKKGSIGIFSKFSMAGGSEFRAAELASSIAKYSDYKSFLFAEKDIPQRVKKQIHEDVEIYENVFAPTPKNKDSLYKADTLVIVNTDCKQFTHVNYWTGKSDRHTESIDLARIKQMVFLFNFLVSPSRHLYSLEPYCKSIKIICTNSKFFYEISKQDRYELVRHFPRLILQSPIDPNRYSSEKSKSDKMRLGMHSKGVSNKWNTEWENLIISANERLGDKISFDFMGINSDLKTKIEKLDGVTIRKENEIPVKDYLENIDIFTFFPSWKREEPWARVVGEAMMTGCPIITTDKGGNKDQIVHGNNGFLCKTVDDFLNAIVYFHNNQDKTKQFSRNSSILSKQFTSEKISSRLIEFIEA